MLRAVVLVLAAGAIAAGAALLIAGQRIAGIYLLLLGVAVCLGIVFERWRYRPQPSRPDAQWQPTGERFEDPHTGKTVEVLYDARSGERRYVSDAAAGSDRSV
ncbi:MAG: hypothetical protein ACRETK_08175 [Steroidobacteraceae bacterium]